MSDYPEGFDCVWIALDAQGRVGAFVTAGEGPVPEVVLGSDVDIIDIEGLLLDMAETGEAHPLASDGDPSSFLALARRGLYVYDWNDVHSVPRPLTDRYQCIARPQNALMADDLPEVLRALAVALPASDFAREDAIAPHHQLPSRRPAKG